MKICFKCKQEKELDQFSVNKKRKDKVNAQCKECQKKYFKEYYKNNKEEHLARVKKIDKTNLTFVWKEKLKHGCKKCGYKEHPAALQFHHRDSKDKSFTISSNYNADRQLLIKEMEKCDVLCANCHAIEHSLFNPEDLHLLDLRPTQKRVKQIKFQGRRKQQTKSNLRPTKEELEKLIWEMRIKDIAIKYNVKYHTVHYWCRRFYIRKPPKSYWTKKNNKKI